MAAHMVILPPRCPASIVQNRLNFHYIEHNQRKDDDDQRTSPGQSIPAPSSGAQQHLYFLKEAHLPPPILTTFYRGTIESILCSCITAWFGNCTVSDRRPYRG
ncbi:gastrula zinc finger protein XlCGF28.1-like [Silurus meridionalis]|nr:gastrula zinc finger protein XlCGF28.1-like [Silurus meridionalis]